ncbi:YhgE/Pip family protein, partial [Rothia sp. P4278]
DGAADLDAGAGKAVDGASQLSQGLGELKKGSSTLSTSLSDAVDKVPSYTDGQAEDLSAVTSDPVAIDKTRINEVSTYGHGLAPYFMTLGLWVGAIAYFMMYPAISAKFARRGHSGLATLRGAMVPVILMGIVQGSVMTIIIHSLVDIKTANFWGLMGFAVLTSITFLAINQALIALLDAPGRFISLMLTVIQIGAAGGTYPIETAPGFLQALHPWLPLTHALEAFRSLIAGGSIGISTGLAWLAGWFILALSGTAASIWIRHRREDRREAERARKNAPAPELAGAAG